MRPVAPADLPFLWDMGWEATAVSPEMRALGRHVALQLPEVLKYLEEWGRAGDAGVIAIDGSGTPLGAAWFRLFPANIERVGFREVGISPDDDSSVTMLAEFGFGDG